MTTYDAAVIQKFADRLYARANSIILTATVAGLVIGGGAGWALGVAANAGVSPAVFGGVGAVLFGLLGYSAGSSRAFSLKLQEQTALCQFAIETNTRNATAR